MCTKVTIPTTCAYVVDENNYSRRSRSSLAQGRYATPRGYAPMESTAMVAFGNQCEPFSIVTPTRANSEGKLQG